MLTAWFPPHTLLNSVTTQFNLCFIRSDDFCCWWSGSYCFWQNPSRLSCAFYSGMAFVSQTGEALISIELHWGMSICHAVSSPQRNTYIIALWQPVWSRLCIPNRGATRNSWPREKCMLLGPLQHGISKPHTAAITTFPLPKMISQHSHSFLQHHRFHHLLLCP